MSRSKKNILVSVSLILIAIIYTILVKTIDLGNIGPENSAVGFSKLNGYVHNLIGVHMNLYKVTQILGLIPLLMAGIYALIGVVELVKRKNLLKIDKEILLLGVFYIIVIGIYVLFEKVIINYRPVLIDGLEASYPSSHTVLALCICMSSIMINNSLFKNIKIAKYENIISIILMIAIVFGRLFSGVHWFTDIIGGIIISIALLKCFKTVLEEDKRKI